MEKEDMMMRPYTDTLTSSTNDAPYVAASSD